ncbi:hypothetical protein ACPA54_09585 [Uniformispora flossi]|uniref:hypothetical protein n=1 Tax=Uniformispora flossi TaxID=3390723 RepID=UPI003C2D7E66
MHATRRRVASATAAGALAVAGLAAAAPAADAAQVTANAVCRQASPLPGEATGAVSVGVTFNPTSGPAGTVVAVRATAGPLPLSSAIAVPDAMIEARLTLAYAGAASGTADLVSVQTVSLPQGPVTLGPFDASLRIPDGTPPGDLLFTAKALSFTITTPYGTLIEDCDFSGSGVLGTFAVTSDTGTQQRPQGTVDSGGLNFEQAAAGMRLSQVTLNGKPQTMTGALNQVAVQDFRGDVLGWDLTGAITDFTSPEKGGLIPADSFTWKPACAVTNPDSPSQVVTGSEGTVGLLCKQNANAPGVVSGGEFTADASAKLPIPAWQLSGTYTATLTLTLI